jgi:hypothetical protein
MTCRACELAVRGDPDLAERSAFARRERSGPAAVYSPEHFGAGDGVRSPGRACRRRHEALCP